MDLPRLAIRQPVTVTIGILIVLLAGLLSLSRLPIALTPTVDTLVITVATSWPGASPEEIERSVIDPQEERLLGLTDLVLVTSTAYQGAGTIRLQFATGMDGDAAMQEVVQKLNEVPSYPENVDEPVVSDGDPENRDYIAWIVLGTTDPGFDVRRLRDFATDRIEPFLERVSGVSEINVLGGTEREVQVRVDLEALAQHGISPTRFAAALRDVNRDVSAGRVADGKLDVRLRTLGRYRDLGEVERTVIGRAPGGAEVRLGDVAEVVATHKEPAGFVRSRSRPVIAINAERAIDANVMRVMAGLREAIGQLNEPGGILEAEARRLGLDGELTLEQVYDQTIYVKDALALVRSNIWIGGALATLVLILFLRTVRSVAIIGLAIPVSIIGAVTAMVVLGRSINVVSLAGLAFSVGMVVDNAIVVLENIHRHLELGKPPMRAAYDGAREVWGAILASTLTTVAVFVPILLIEEEAGQLFRDIAIAICAAVALSLLVSITVIPSAASRILRERRGTKPATHRVAGAIAGFVYLVSGSWIARIAVVASLTAASVIGTMMLAPPADYLPKGNRNLVFGLIIPPPGYNLEQYERLAERVERTIRPTWEAGLLADDPAALAAAEAAIPPVRSWTGREVRPPALQNYFLVNFDDILFHGAIAVDPGRAADMVPLLASATSGDVAPGAIAFPFQVPLFQLGGSSGSAIKLQLSGPELDEVVRCAGMTYGALVGAFGPYAVQPEPANFSLTVPEIQIVPDLVRLSEVGLSVTDLGLLVRAAGDGATVDDYSIGGESIDLTVIATRASDARGLENLASTPIATPSGATVTLGSLAEIRRSGGPQQIARVGRRRAVSFQVTPPEGIPLEAAVADIEGIIAGFRASGAIPVSVESEIVGTASKLRAVSRALLGDGTLVGAITSSFGLALLVIWMLMAVLFQSFLKPLVILFSVPLATFGGFAALAAVHAWSLADPLMPVQQLDVLTMLGFVLLIGVVVNNAILIVHQAIHFMEGRAEDAKGNMERLAPRRAVAEAVRSRVRPIFMGTLTSVGGMLPLVLMPGAGSELYRGLGSVVVGGLLVSTIFTLLLVPLLLSIVLDLAALLRPGMEDQPAPSSLAQASNANR